MSSLPSLPPHFFRFTFKSLEDIEHLVHWLQCNKQKFIVCREIGHNSGEKEHLHVLSFADKKEQQFRRLFKNEFPEYSGNEDFAFTSLGKKGIFTINDIKDTEQYICKGISEHEKPNIIASFGYTESDFVTSHINYWTQNKQIKNTIKIKGEKKAKEKTWTEKIVEEWKNENFDKLEYTVPNKMQVLKHVLSMFRKDVKGFDTQIIRRACNAVWSTMMNKEFVDDIYIGVYPKDEFYINQYMK